MGFHRSYLRCLGVLSLLLMGGCSWVANVEWPRDSASQPTSPVSESDLEQNREALASDTASPIPSTGPASNLNPSSTPVPSIDHGERLSTLDDGLPPGRLPPEIVPATGNAERLPQIESGRRDPFASLPVRPFLVQQNPVASTSIATPPSVPTPSSVTPGQPTIPPSPQVVVPVPITSQRPTPPIAPPQPSVPTVPTVVETAVPNASPLPVEPVNVASVPPSPSFEFSGVVQVGDRVNIIVEEPAGSRYVQIGERVGNGQFVIKSVDFHQGSTPAVILERGGIESMHWVGSPIAM